MTMPALPSVSSASSSAGLEGGDDLELVFRRFALFGTNDDSAMDNARFAKMCAESELGLSTTDVDLVFTRSKEKGKRKLDFRLFRLRALPMLAERLGVSVLEVATAMLATQAPRVGTATPVRVDGVFETLTDVRGYTGMYGSRFGKAPSTKRRFSRTESFQHLPEVPSSCLDELRQSFFEFASYGGGLDMQTEMDNGNFSKLCRECGLMSKRLPQTEVDLIFARSKEKDTRRIDFAQFARRAVPMVAVAKGCDLGALCEAISRTRPQNSNPTAVRTDAGVYKKLTDEAQYTGMHAGRFGRQHSVKEQRKDVREALPAVPKQFVTGLNAAFLDFAAYGGGLMLDSETRELAMDNAKFAKMVREAGLLEGGLTAADADLVFSKTCGRGHRRLSWQAFLRDAVPLLAHTSGAEVGALAARLCAAAPRNNNATEADTEGVYDKLTDQLRYTGMYAERFGIRHREAHTSRMLEHTAAKGQLDELPEMYAPALKSAFRRFSGGPLDMSEERFSRMAADARLLDAKLAAQDVSLIFHLSKERYAATLDFELFFAKAVPLLALAKGADVHGVGKRLADAAPEQPRQKLARAVQKAGIFDRLTNPDNFTGMYKERFSDRPGSSRTLARNLSTPRSARPWSQRGGLRREWSLS